MTKIKIAIKNRWTGSVIFEYEKEDNTIKDTVLAAIKADANLSDANLSDADLSDADLSDANLSDADLSDADLSDANLRRANLSDANLSDANLSDADLSDANLRRANLSDANLSDANLSDADLSDADLRRANLRRANLSIIKHDFFIVLLHAIPEVKFLKQNIVEGNINGSTYDGDCACLSGTLANGCKIHNGPEMQVRKDLIFRVRDAGRPIERFFLGINPGDKPETSQFSKLALEWLEEFENLISAAK